MSIKAYKFRDRETGLYWTGNLKPGRGTMFSEVGTEVRDLNSATSLWRQYEAMRRMSQKIELPAVERVMFEVGYTELEASTEIGEDRWMIPLLFARATSPHSHSIKFARQVVERHDWKDYPYMIETRKGGRRSRLDDLVAMLDRPLVSSRQTSHRFIAVRSDKDVLVAKLQMSDSFDCAYEMATARRLT